jgi:hypothetical protein
MDINSVFPSRDLAREDPAMGCGSGQWAKKKFDKNRTFKISGHFLPQWKRKNVEAQIMLFLTELGPLYPKSVKSWVSTYFFLL